VIKLLKWLGLDRQSREHTQTILAEADERAEKTTALVEAQKRVRRGEMPPWSINKVVDELLGIEEKYDRGRRIG
jgi:hypothetical protein